MLGSNPSADQWPRPINKGMLRHPLQSLPSRESQHRERHQAINPGVRGKAPAACLSFKDFF